MPRLTTVGKVLLGNILLAISALAVWGIFGNHTTLLILAVLLLLYYLCAMIEVDNIRPWKFSPQGNLYLFHTLVWMQTMVALFFEQQYRAHSDIPPHMFLVLGVVLIGLVFFSVRLFGDFLDWIEKDYSTQNDA